MEKILGVCGCICSDCRIYKTKCEGCHEIEGKACWLSEVNLEVCDFYECAVTERNFKHCGECEQIPCEKFWKNKNPAWSDEKHKQIVHNRVKTLKKLAGREIDE